MSDVVNNPLVHYGFRVVKDARSWRKVCSREPNGTIVQKVDDVTTCFACIEHTFPDNDREDTVSYLKRCGFEFCSAIERS
jgi:Ni,Fe-hydrogenase I small subunit